MPNAPSCDTSSTHSWQNGNWMLGDLYCRSDNISCFGVLWLGFPSAGQAHSAVLFSWRVDELLVPFSSVYVLSSFIFSVRSRELCPVTALLLTTNTCDVLHWQSHKPNDHASTHLMHCQTHSNLPQFSQTHSDCLSRLLLALMKLKTSCNS